MPDNTEIPSFTFGKVTFPKIIFGMIATPKIETLDQAFKMNVLIMSDNEVRLLLGIQVSSKEKYQETNCIMCQIDALGEYHTSFKIDKKPTLDNIPMIGNMAAALFPFVREKVHSCLQSNGMAVLLPPLNVIQMLKDFANSSAFAIQDLRVPPDSAKAPLESEKSG